MNRTYGAKLGGEQVTLPPRAAMFMGQQNNGLKKLDFLLSNCALSSQINGKSINNCELLVQKLW
jgi:hypothetical protein